MSIVTLLEDSGWRLRCYNPSTPEYWVAHSCQGLNGSIITRYLKFIADPCEACGSVCPEGIQGVYMMMAYL